MDASEDTPLGPPSAGASITVPNNAATSAARAEAIGTAALPEWDLDSASLPTDPLAPNPDSEWLASSDEFSLLSTPASFPPEWTTLVASDVAQMAVASSTAAITAEEGASEGDDASFAARRLSDAYIAGMPSKRRRVCDSISPCCSHLLNGFKMCVIFANSPMSRLDVFVVNSPK